MRRGIERAVAAVVEALKNMSVDIKSTDPNGAGRDLCGQQR